LRANLLYAFADHPPKVIVLTSPGSREGKSTACANLGVGLAQVENNVLILDCDLRSPAQHEVFGLRNLYGIVDVLAGERELQEVWQGPLPGLKMIAAGPIPLNPAELLSSSRFAELIGQVRERFDFVLIDSPPVGPTSDAAILSTRADGVLFVLDAQITPEWTVRRSLSSLHTVGANVLGTVMNNVDHTNYPYFGQTYYAGTGD